MPKVMGKSRGASVNDAIFYALSIMPIEMYFTNLHLSFEVHSS